MKTLVGWNTCKHFQDGPCQFSLLCPLLQQRTTGEHKFLFSLSLSLSLSLSVSVSLSRAKQVHKRDYSLALSAVQRKTSKLAQAFLF